MLPFANLSPDPENEYFSDGISDDLIAQIAKVGPLRVISRTSVIRYKNSDKSLRQIGDELGVATILEGSVRRAGNRVRVVAQLIDAGTDEHLWSETYDRQLDDVFAVQSDVALNIAHALQANLTAVERQRLARKPTADPAAYDLYLLGRHHTNKRTDESIRKGIEYFERAIALDPAYAAAHAGLAESYLFAGLGYVAMMPAEAFAIGKAAATRAVALDETLPEALCARGLALLFADWDVAQARQTLERAVALNPNHAPAHQWLAWCLVTIGEYVAALGAWERALEIDPLSVVLITESGWPYSYMGLHHLALPRYARALELDPGFALAHYDVGVTYAGTKMYDLAIAAYERAIALGGRAPFYLASLAAACVDAGQRRRAEAVLEELVAQSRPGSGRLATALVCDALGETERALEALESAFAEHEPFVITWSSTAG